MLQSVFAHLQDFFHNVRIVDFLDVAIISVFLYLFLNWLRQSASRRSIISITILIGLYILARFTEMYLTELLLEGLFLIIVIGVVVVFQSDIRRLIDQLGSLSWFWEKPSFDSSNITTNLITEAAAKLAEHKTGALIAIKGKENWERQMTGGIKLNGELSIPLLLSIFNTKAPGHDGAVLVEGDTIVRFGTHLPLSTHLNKIGKGGTRHAAALGLAEQCDALIVVVSEERGTISVAQDKTLSVLSSASELKARLDNFWQEHYTEHEQTFAQWWRKRSLRTAIASVCLACIFWFALAYQSDTVYRTFTVPIEYRNLQSSNVALQDSVPTEARLTLSGPSQAFRLFDPSQLVISFNLAKLEGTETLQITDKNVNLPSDLHLYEATPRTLKVRPKILAPIQLPVQVRTTGKLPDGLELQSVNPSRAAITVLADTSSTDLPKNIKTKPIDLRSVKESGDIQAELIVPKGMQLPQGAPNNITVTVHLKNN